MKGDPDVFPEQVCFHAQQAAEKAAKAVLVARGIDFPYTHNVKDLLDDAAKNGIAVPAQVRGAADLTRYASETRYPDPEVDITGAEMEQAIDVAKATVDWAAAIVPMPEGSRERGQRR